MNHNLTAEEKLKRDDRVRYYIVKLKGVMSKSKIFETIEKNGVTSKSTAERVSKGVLDWKQGEIELFLATYNPTKSDSEAIGEFLEVNASKVSNEVSKECVSDNKQIEEELKIKQEEDKCTECDIEAAHIINELSAKNQELHKELHTSKNVITTLQKGVEELNENVTESKCMIAEICKERDDKAKEIRVLNLDLLRKDNNMDKLVEDFREMEKKCEILENSLKIKEEESKKNKSDYLLSLKYREDIESDYKFLTEDLGLNPKYDSLYKVLLAAYNQASNGKGKERHQLNDEEYFENQKICEIARRLSIDYNLGQAVKKIYESKRLTDGRDIAELYGAINYIAAAIIVKQEEKQNE